MSSPEGMTTRSPRPSSSSGPGVSEPIIRMRGVSFVFGAKVVLEGFSLDVARGEKVVLTGPSGSGKTTILRALLGFVLPSRGSISINSHEIGPDNIWHLRALMGYVPQEPELENGTVRQWLEKPFSYRANRALRSNLGRIPELFHHFLLPLDLLEKEVRLLSGGEKQRVAMVSALLLDRPILLLDEPTSALDDLSRRRVTESLSSRPDLTALIVSHDPGLHSVAHRVVGINQKKSQWVQ